MLNKQLQTFISYSREDQLFALKLASELKSANFAVWMDQYDIPTGARWDDEIEKALGECEIFMFIMTPASVASENAKDEMGYAIDHGKYILPVLLEKCEIPLRLTRLQYVDFTQKSFSEGIKSAKELLSEMVNEIEASIQENKSPATHTSNQKELHQAVDEPVTRPSKNVARLYSSEFSSTRISRIKGRNKRILVWIIAGTVGIGGIFAISALLLQPLLTPPIPTLTATIAPTQMMIPTDSPVPTIISVTQTPTIPRSFTENFGANSQWDKNWALQFRHSDLNKQKNFQYTIADGKLVFNLTHQYVWGYFLYDASVIYSNVEMEVVVEDLISTETFALVCHYSDKGWYEFDINGGGEYDLRYVDNMDSDIDEDAKLIKKGFIKDINYSVVEPSENKIRVICNGNNLSLFVNDSDVLNNHISNQFILEQGQIGIAVRSYENYPLNVIVKSITVHEQ